MDTRKWITLMAVVLFLGGFSPTEACRCILNHPQRSYCKDNAALKMKFLEATTRTVPGSQNVQKGFKVEVDMVLKGNEALKSVTFISTLTGTSCEYTHPSNEFHKDYFITASVNNNDASVHGCNYIVPWNELTLEQRKGVEGAYNKGCACEIISCTSQPCSTPEKTCVIEEYNGGDSEDQLKNQVCVLINPNTCEWKDIVED
ncbi:hypothetical protein NDU88_000969 [Pleurodeles waltl]|uniref:NTR domain-containing protein n=1 Tax=Pleurodeles waltl TaxID=8319 RepID=A0AAV7M3Y7_PLEWA|nr:hypothetical protein NDU88_000969 [Pleurodeles waltl]